MEKTMEKAYDFTKLEKKIQDYWKEKKIYKKELARENNFSIDTPPPTASGKSLHIGHVFSYTQTDIIARYKQLVGFNVLYPMGFDDNGLPTEKFVEKKLKIKAAIVGRKEFKTLCQEEVKAAVENFKNLFNSLGFAIDWSKSYSTISEASSKISQELFLELYEKDLVYRKEEPVIYCPNCRTSISQAELEEIEVETSFNTILFKAKDGTSLSIATTRPELLASCSAILFNPQDKRYQHLKDTFAKVPVYDFEVPIFEDDHVVIDKGTGLVMFCTFGDKTDTEWFKKFDSPYKESINKAGKMTKITGFLEGQKVAEARANIIKKLKEIGALAEQKPHSHAINVHDRCKKEIEYTTLKQWFFKILPFKEKFIEQGEKINWFPKFMRSRYKNWVKNINWDWCLSRQRFNGVPFPVWYCTNCDEIILANKNELPVDPTQKLPSDKCHCGGEIIGEHDIMDTWNTSSLTPYLVADLYNSKIEDFFPMNLRSHAHDIIRTWTFYAIAKAYALDNKIPWENLMISGHVLANSGKKISKSQANNPLVPENLLKLYPADAIRHWTASSTIGQDIPFSEDQIRIGKRLLTKIWNAFKFQESILENTPKSTQQLKLKVEEINPTGLINRWIIHRLNECSKNYIRNLDSYSIGSALEILEQFFWSDFCDNFLEIIKDQFFNPDRYKKHEPGETKAVLYYVNFKIIQLFSPFLPHITEVLYQENYKELLKIESIHKTLLKETQTNFKFPDSAKIMDVILEIIKNVRKAKSESHLSLKAEINQLQIVFYKNALGSYDTENLFKKLKEQQKIISGVIHAKKINYEILEKDYQHKPSKISKEKELLNAKIFIR